MKSLDDLVAAVRLPEALWMATACPTAGLRCDSRFLELMDTDGNGRIRVEEMRAAVAFTSRMLQDHSGCDAGSDVLRLGHLSADASHVRAAALLLLEHLNASTRDAVSWEQVRGADALLREHHIHGDGVVAPEAIQEPRLAQLARDVMRAFPPRKNRAGQEGFDVDRVESFRARRKAALEHLDRGERVKVLGPRSVEVAQDVERVTPRVDEFFLQCRLVASQPEALAHLKLKGEKLDALVGNPRGLDEALASLPLASLDPDGILMWSRLNRGPLHEVLQRIHDEAAPHVGAGERMTEAQWRALKECAQEILAWYRPTQDDPVLRLGDALRTITDDELNRLRAFSEEDLALRDRVAAMGDLERLVLNQRWLLSFANNFISMPDLYAPDRHALFERGRLVLAGRELSFAVLVPDRAAHSKLAEEGTMFIAYVALQRRGGEESLEVAVPVTWGTSAGFAVGKRGVFYDHLGQEYDATITHVVRQPVSLWEAATAPFTRIGRFIGGKIEALSQAGEKSLDVGLETAYTGAAKKEPVPAATPAPGTGALIAGGGVAFAAVGSSLAFMMGQLKSLTLLDVFNAMLAVVLVVSAPSALLGWLKLRKRNLAIVLEGAGWALNDRLMLTRELGALFTRRPPRPANSRVELKDTVAHALRVHAAAQPHDVEGAPQSRWWVGTKIAVGLVVILLWQYRETVMALVQWMIARE
ncbi:MAG: kinesin [Myxococcota bacterium]